MFGVNFLKRNGMTKDKRTKEVKGTKHFPKHTQSSVAIMVSLIMSEIKPSK
jgi:hypothetical protein